MPQQRINRCALFLIFLTMTACHWGKMAANAAQNNHYASSLTFQVEARDELCFFEEISPQENPAHLSFEFEVVRGGLLDIRVKVSDPSNHVILERLAFFNRQDEGLNESEGKVDILLNAHSLSGKYSICFDNSMSRWTPKMVSYFIPHATSSALDRKALNEDAAKLTDLGPMVDSIILIADQLDAIESQQHHARVREQSHRDVSDQLDQRVQMWSVLESMVLIGLTGWQLMYVKNWFSMAGNKHSRV